MRWFARLVRAAEARRFHPLGIFLVATWVASIRFLLEKAFIYDASKWLPQDDLGIIMSWIVFYAALGICISAILVHLAKTPWRTAVQVVSFGLTLATFPPLIDVLVYGRGNFFYRYQRDFFADTTFLLFNPKEGLPIGEALVVWTSIIFTGLYVYLKTKTVWKAVVAGALQYGLGVFFGVLLPLFVQWVLSLPGSGQLGTKWIMAYTGLFVLMVAYGILRPAVLREGAPRLPQVLLAPALAFLGGAFIDRVTLLTALATLALAGVATVFSLTNLHYDRAEDTASGRSTHLEAEDAQFFHAWSLVLVICLMRHHVFVALCAGMFLVVAWAYHADPLRTKCIFPLSYKSEGFFALVSFLAGILVHRRHPLGTAEITAAFLIFGGFSLSAAFKDAKDVAGDRAAGVRTLYVVLESRGWSFNRIHILAATLLTTSLVVPVGWLTTRDAPVAALAPVVLCALAAAGSMALPNRRLGVAVGVSAVALYVGALAWAVLQTSTGAPTL